MASFSKYDEEIIKVLEEGEFVSKDDLISIKHKAKKSGVNIAQAVVDLAIMPDDQIGILVSDTAGIPFIKVSGIEIPAEVLELIPPNIAKGNNIIPIKIEGNELHIATSDIHQKELFRFLEKKTRRNLKLFYSAKSDINEALRVYEIPLEEKLKKTMESIDKKGEKESSEVIANLLDDIIYFAAQEHASDIHIEPQNDEILVRARVDGILRDILFLPKNFQEIISTRIKVLSNLRTDQHRSPQDGRIKMEFPGLMVTLRVSIIPIYDGEKVVLRLLASQSSLKLENLGYSDNHLNLIYNSIKKTHGMILVTGPTGCGKTTTLYSVLRILNKREVNLSTIEDPIEIRLQGANQIQVNPGAKLTFASGLRSILRQDPDIILVGEIRDLETANIAVNSALTGHLVLATLHTNDAASTLPRLLEMGVDNFLAASTVNIVIAQRLARKICQGCITTVEKPIDELIGIFSAFDSFDQNLFINDNPQKKTITIYKGNGCRICNKSGYKGRVAIAEFIEVDAEIRTLIKNKALSSEIVEIARKKGMITMMEDGFEKILNGMTSVEEVLRITQE